MPLIIVNETPNQSRIATKIGIQILNRIEPMEEANIVLVDKIINQLLVE